MKEAENLSEEACMYRKRHHKKHEYDKYFFIEEECGAMCNSRVESGEQTMLLGYVLLRVFSQNIGGLAAVQSDIKWLHRAKISAKYHAGTA
jgi:hypothetical protein